MAIDYEDVEGWFGFEVDVAGVDYPTQAMIAAFIAVAQSDFEAFTDKTFDETDAKHLLLLKMLIDKQLYNWYKMRAGYAESFSTPAGSTSRAHSYVYYDRQQFNKLIEQIANGKTIGDTLIYYEGED